MRLRRPRCPTARSIVPDVNVRPHAASMDLLGDRPNYLEFQGSVQPSHPTLCPA